MAGDRYRIVTATSDTFGAGTDAKVGLQFTDASGATWTPTFSQTKAMFERNKQDEFFVAATAKLGEIASCRVWIENPGMGDNWHLDHVLLTHLPSQRQWRFNCRDWVPKGAGPMQGKQLPAVVVKDVPLEGPPPGAVGAGADADTARLADQDAARPPPKPLTVYTATVVTGDKFGAGTDALISMEVTGSRDVASHTFETSKALFEKGSRDVFRLTLPDVGNVTSIRLWHDGSGFGSDWFPASVSVEHPTAGCKWEAVFNEWIKGGEPNGRSKPARMVAGTPEDAERAHEVAKAAAGAKDAERRRVAEEQAAAARAAQQQQAGAAAGGGSDTAPVADNRPPRAPVKKPGDEGIARQVLKPDEFARLPQMQPGDARYRFSNEVRGWEGAGRGRARLGRTPRVAVAKERRRLSQWVSGLGLAYLMGIT